MHLNSYSQPLLLNSTVSVVYFTAISKKTFDDDDDICGGIFDPVCGSDGRTYYNRCYISLNP